MVKAFNTSYIVNKAVIMNNKEVIVLIVILAVVAVVALLPAKKRDAEMLFFKSLTVGNGSENYLYEYEEETVKGFVVKTTLIKQGPTRFAEITTPISKKTVYFLPDDTLMCVEIGEEKACDSFMNETAVQKYLNSVSSLFIDDAKISNEIKIMKTLSEKGALTFSDEVIDAEVDGRACKEISFLLNYSVLSLTDLAALGIKGTPFEIYGSYCVDPESGERYTKRYNYTYLGKAAGITFKLLNAEWNATKEISIPTVFDNNTLSLIYTENELEQEVLECLDKSDKSKMEHCIRTLALEKRFAPACELAGDMKEMCFMNVAIIERKTGLCEKTGTLRDDCYIEIAAKELNSTYCDQISDLTKKQFCYNVSMIIQ